MQIAHDTMKRYGNVSDAVTGLLVAGNRPDQFKKASISGSDFLVIDLEGSVPRCDKEIALNIAVSALAPRSPLNMRAMVRMNGSSIAERANETVALRDLARQRGHGLLGIMLPMIEEPQDVAEVANLFFEVDPSLTIVPLIETIRGVDNVGAIAAVVGVTRLALGAKNIGLDTEVGRISQTVDFARARLVIASRAAGIRAPLDSPAADVTDFAAISAEATFAHSYGFGGKLCTHPDQVGVIKAAFAQSAAEVAWARIADTANAAPRETGSV